MLELHGYSAGSLDCPGGDQGLPGEVSSSGVNNYSIVCTGAAELVEAREATSEVC